MLKTRILLLSLLLLAAGARAFGGDYSHGGGDDDDDTCSSCDDDSCKVLEDVNLEHACIGELCIDGHRQCPSDGDPCTQDEWDKHIEACVHIPIPNCCTKDAQCVNKLASPFDLVCTLANCNTYTNQCDFHQKHGCCVESDDCPALPCESVECAAREEAGPQLVRKRNAMTGALEGDIHAHEKRFIPEEGSYCNYTRLSIAECCQTSQECCEYAGINQIGICDKNCTCQFLTQIAGQCAVDDDCVGKINCKRCESPICWKEVKNDPGICECVLDEELDEDNDGVPCVEDCDDTDREKQSIHTCCPADCDVDEDMIPQCGTQCTCECTNDDDKCGHSDDLYEPCDVSVLDFMPEGGCEGAADGATVTVVGGHCDHCDACDNKATCSGDTLIWCAIDEDKDMYHKCNTTRDICAPFVWGENATGPFTPPPPGRKRTISTPAPPPSTTQSPPTGQPTMGPSPTPPPDRCEMKMGVPYIEIEMDAGPACETCDEDETIREPQLCLPDPNNDGLSVCFGKSRSRRDQIRCCRKLFAKTEHDLLMKPYFEELRECCEDLIDEDDSDDDDGGYGPGDDDDDGGGVYRKRTVVAKTASDGPLQRTTLASSISGDGSKRFWGYRRPQNRGGDVMCPILEACECPEGYCREDECGEAECEGHPSGSYFHVCYADWDQDGYIQCEKRKLCSTDSDPITACQAKNLRHITDPAIINNTLGTPICDCNDECRNQNRLMACAMDMDEDEFVNCTTCKRFCVANGQCPESRQYLSINDTCGELPDDQETLPYDSRWERDYWNAHKNDECKEPDHKPPSSPSGWCKSHVPPVDCTENQTVVLEEVCSDVCDCCDGDDKAFPGSTYVSTKETACGGHDYNCDNETTSYICCNDPAEGWHYEETECAPLDPYFTKNGTDSCGGCAYNSTSQSCNDEETCVGWECSDHCQLVGRKRTIISDCPSECAQEDIVTCISSQSSVWPIVGQCAEVITNCTAHPEEEKCLPEEHCCARAGQ